MPIAAGQAKRKGNRGGKGPTKYRAEYCQIAKQILAIGGTDADLACALDVSETTLWRWRSKHKEFLQAYKEGAEFSDQRVEASFYKRAVGYEQAVEKLLIGPHRVAQVECLHHQYVRI